jgi:hypothetical protein
MATLRIPGKKLTQKENESSVFKSPLMEKLKAHAETYQIEGTQRALTNANITSISDDDVIYYTFEDGSGMFLSYDEIVQLNKNENLANPNRSKNYGDDILLPIQYSSGFTRNGTNATNIIRGASIIKGEIVDKIVGTVGKGAALIIAKRLEKSLVKNEGVFIVYPDGKVSDDKQKESDNEKYFLLIHGTNSNTTNAFNDASSLEKGDIEKNVIKSIYEKYDNHVLAFELSSVLLLGALVGAAIIARPRKQ